MSCLPDKIDWEVRRTPFELKNLVSDCHKALDKLPEQEKDYRLRQGLWKVFREEVCPIAGVTYAVFRHSQNVKVYLRQTRPPNEPEYDGSVMLENRQGQQEVYLQVTLALGKDRLREDKLRMEVLNEQGCVPATGPVTIQKGHGNAKQRKICCEEEAVNAPSVGDVAKRISSAIERKRKKQDDYPRPVWLIVVCDDIPPSPLANPDVKNGLGQVPRLEIAEMIEREDVMRRLKFKRLFLVGQSGGFLQELRVPGPGAGINNNGVEGAGR